MLDVGSGLGGPARLLANTRDWHLTCVDLVPEFCQIASALSARADLSARTTFCAGNTLRLPFASGVFDAVWAEHVAMNICARDDLYREMARVVRPGGLLAIYDVVVVKNTPSLTFPVPWAREAEHSHLLTADMLRGLVTRGGWTTHIWNDESAFARDWLPICVCPKVRLDRLCVMLWATIFRT